MLLLAIDPGINSGWAIFENNILVACGKNNPPSEYSVTQAVIESPRIYPHGGTRDPNAIVKLALNAGEHAGLLRARGVQVRYVEPHAWKRSLDPSTCCRRVWGRLSPDEKLVAKDFEPPPVAVQREVPDRLTHTLDAIGIGLHAIGRWRA